MSKTSINQLFTQQNPVLLESERWAAGKAQGQEDHMRKLWKKQLFLILHIWNFYAILYLYLPSILYKLFSLL